MIAWIIIAVVAVPLLVMGYLAMRRNIVVGEHGDDAETTALTEKEFAEAEAYQAKWHEQDKERYDQERLP